MFRRCLLFDYRKTIKSELSIIYCKKISLPNKKGVPKKCTDPKKLD